MGDSLREQLLRSGLVKPARARKRPGSECAFPPERSARKPDTLRGKVHSDPGFGAGEMDLARAWAIRKRTEAVEHERTRAQAQAEAQARKERTQRLRQTLQDKALNRPDAERVRHFEYGGRIRRIYVDAAQLAALNAGQLGVVQLKGAYVLVTREVAAQVRVFAPDHVALLMDPGAGGPDDGVPDDLTW